MFFKFYTFYEKRFKQKDLVIFIFHFAICVGGISLFFFYRNKNKIEKIACATDMFSAAKYAI